MKIRKRTRVHQTKPKPGGYVCLPFERYATAKALNQSRLKSLLISPAHFAADGHKESTALSFGRLAHELTLTPRGFRNRFVIWDGGRRYGKAWDQFQADNAGKEIVTQADYDAAKLMAKSVRSSDLGRQYIAKPGTGLSEVSLFWTETIDGVELTLKSRLDHVHPDMGIVDLKTTTARNREEFAREAAKWRYEMQVAYYLRGWEAVTGTRLANHEFTFLVVEKGTNIVSAYWLPADVLAIGRDQVNHALRRYVECVKSGRWPGPNDNRAEELTHYFPRDFEGSAVDMGQPDETVDLEDVLP
jgi:exodeoxyribonuclease VIII